MTLFMFPRLMAVVFALSLAAPASAQPIHWWTMEPAKIELGLTTDQSTQIESIFQQSISQLRQQKVELDRLEDALSRLIESSADEGVVTRQIDRVETVRAGLNKTRTLMLLHMRGVLTPEQRVKLNAMYARSDQERRDRNKQRQSSGSEQRPHEQPRRPSNQ